MKPVLVRDGDGWHRRSETVLYDHPYIRLEEVIYDSPHRSEPVSWIVARRKPGVIVAPRLADGRFLMIRQERYPIQQVLWEFPAGQIDAPDFQEHPERIEETALRELREESGHQLSSKGELIPLGHFFASQGFTDEHAYLFLATEVEPTGKGPEFDDGEMIVEQAAFTFAEIQGKIASGELVDANSLVLMAKLCAMGLVE
ncbi:MAG: NUDIX hydrolase [Verrucomicrobiota bacterium]